VPELTFRKWCKNYADELQRLTKCARDTAMDCAKNSKSNWEDGCTPEECAFCEASEWVEN
jgi:hypothetical protein